MTHYTGIGQCLFLLIVANGVPIIARELLGDRGNCPVDCGIVWRDERPLLGPTKTVRGILAAVCATGLTAPLASVSVVTGTLFGLCSMFGDLLSSFIKRRLDVKSSDRVLGLDQGLEALCPVLVFRDQFDLQVLDALAIIVAFFVLEIVLSHLLYRLPTRNRIL